MESTVKTDSKQIAAIKVIDSKINVLINNFIFLITFMITDFQGPSNMYNNDMKRKRESLKVFVVFFK